MSTLKLGVAVLATVTALTTASNHVSGQERRAVAAPGQPGGAEADVPSNITWPVVLLTQKAIQEDLKLSEEQLKKLPEFRLNVYRKIDLPSIPLDDSEVRQLARRQVNDAIQGELKKFLTAEQYKRLGQITLQSEASRGSGLVTLFRRSEVVNELRLTEPQKEVIAGIRKELQDSFLDRLRGEREERDKRMADLRTANNSRILQSLTDGQKAKWKEMLGAEFSGKIELQRR